MKPGRQITTVVCIIVPFIAKAGEQPTAEAKSVVVPASAVELQLLQGTWEGVMVGDNARQKITIAVTGNSFHFHRDTNFWFETTIVMPAGKAPKQLHATIKGCPPSQASSIGQVVVAIFKIEDGRLTLATGNGDGEAPKSFEATGDNGLNRYELRKVLPQKKISGLPRVRMAAPVIFGALAAGCFLRFGRGVLIAATVVGVALIGVRRWTQRGRSPAA